MALDRRIGKMFENIAGVAMDVGKVGGKAAGTVAKSGLKGAVNVGNKVMDGVETAIKADKKAIVRNNVGKVKRAGAKTVDNVLTNDASYAKIGNAGFSGKMNLLDEVATHGRATGNAAYKLARGKDITSFTGPISGKQRTISTALLKKSDESLIGLRATGLGAAVMIGGAAMAGVPRGAQAALDERRGRADGQATGHAPGQMPAYAQNAGATGDLVFALNDLRRG